MILRKKRMYQVSMDAWRKQNARRCPFSGRLPEIPNSVFVECERRTFWDEAIVFLRPLVRELFQSAQLQELSLKDSGRDWAFQSRPQRPACFTPSRAT